MELGPDPHQNDKQFTSGLQPTTFIFFKEMTSDDWDQSVIATGW